MGFLAGLTAALAWTLASSLWRGLTTSLKAPQLNGLKNAIACLVLLPVLVAVPWLALPKVWTLLLVSGAVGIAAGDSCYLGALRRLGTRRALTVEALAPLVAAISGLLWMGEQLSPQAWCGAALVSGSVLIVALQHPPSRTAQIDCSRQGQLLGLGLALLAVIFGVIGAAISRNVLLQADVAPIQSAAVRLLGGLAALLPWLGWCWWKSGGRPGIRRNRRTGPQPGQRRALRVVTATLLGTNLGILLQQAVLQQLPLAVAITLLSTAPVMALAVAHQEGDHPQGIGLMASLLAVGGVALAVFS